MESTDQYDYPLMQKCSTYVLVLRIKVKSKQIWKLALSLFSEWLILNKIKMHITYVPVLEQTQTK